MTGPQLTFSDNLHANKYRSPGESHREAMGRISSVLCDGDDHYQQFRDLLLGMFFLPAGRIQAAIGASKNVTAYNCFVSGTIEDTFVDGHGSIMGRATEAATTMRMGGGIGYDFSTLRPSGSLIKKLQSRTKGPISFLEIYNAVGFCTSSTDDRRGAQMGVLRVDHPDVEQFIRIKQAEGVLPGFNLSLAITDRFMECVKTGEPFPLVWGGEVHREVDAHAIWEMIMRSTWDWADPGVLFIDTINRMNNLWYCETIVATNPCGEQPLPPYGACLLGSINLVKYLRNDPVDSRWYFDWDQLKADIPAIVRAMDNVVDRTVYPLFEQEKEAKSKRRMGLGVTGLANALEALDHPYGSSGFLKMEGEILDFIANQCYLASIDLAKEKGPFPMFEKSQYLQGQFIQTRSQEVQDGIAEYGIRNSHLTSIAPTGTISLTADNVSAGIEPVIGLSVDRTIQTFDGPTTETLEDYGLRVFGVSGRTIADVTVEEHLAVLATAAHHVDSAVSKTCNVGDDVPWEDFKQVYMSAWEQGCKGCTTYRAAGKRGGGVITVNKTEGAACATDPLSGHKDCG